MSEETGNTGGFGLPEDYFRKQARIVQQKLEWGEEIARFPRLTELRNALIFSQPEGYHALAREEIKVQLNLVLLDKGSGFKVPDSYFENNKEQIGKRLEAKPRPKVLSLRRSWQFAAAAVLIVSGAFWAFEFTRSGIEPEDCLTLACIEKQELTRSRLIESLSAEELMQIVEDEEGLTPEATKSADTTIE